jgi:hypothetical protein
VTYNKKMHQEFLEASKLRNATKRRVFTEDQEEEINLLILELIKKREYCHTMGDPLSWPTEDRKMIDDPEIEVTIQIDKDTAGMEGKDS